MLNKFFVRHSFKVILVVLFLLPVFSRGARKALLSNDNNVHDWLPDKYDETADFAWFQQHFDNETFVLVSWEGCTLDDPRLELFAKKIVPPNAGAAGRPRPAEKASPAQMVRRSLLLQVVPKARSRRRCDQRPACSRASKPVSD